MQSNQAQFRVLIAGGGIAGLSLALSLEHAGIDYILLEARDEFAPQLGASIGLGPNGGRILDQLGCYDEILHSTAPIEYTGSHRHSDGAFIRPKTDAFRLVHARSNYSMCFLDRQKVLHILAKHIKDHDKLHLGKRIVHAEEYDSGIKVSCDDGTFYEGQVLVGADGVHSTVRREMWRVAGERIPREDRFRMAAEYRCLYAISAPIPGLPSQEFDVTYKKDVSPIVITGKDGRVYWFLIERLAQTYPYGEIPRYNKQDADSFVAKHFEIALMPDAKVTVRDLWQNRETFSLVPLEEGFLDHWTFGRFVCLGDSVHKMTPNLGSGGNSAIESAASLTNELRALLVQTRSLDTPIATDEVHHALSNYHRTRITRASATFKASRYITRLHAMRGPFEYVLAHYIMPRAGDLLTDLASDSWIGAVRLDFLPVPLRSLGGTMPFNPEQGLGKNESLIRRALYAMPILALSYLAWIRENSTARDLNSPGFVAYFGTLYGVMLLESARRANTLLPMQWPLMVGAASLFFGVEKVMPVYFFLHYTLTPISRFRAKDLRLTDLSYTGSVLPTMLVLWYIPFLLNWWTIEDKVRLMVALLCFISTTQWTVHYTGIIPSTIQDDRINNVSRDLTTLKRTGAVLAAFSAGTWVVVTISPCLFHFRSALKSEWANLGVLPDETLLSAASIMWISYLFQDLKRAKMMDCSWMAILALLVASTACFGPTATVAAGWVWREQILATKSHWGAIVTSDA